MKNAVIAAIVAAIVSSGTTYAATKINGRSIAKHSIPASKLTPKAVTEFTRIDPPSVLAGKVSSTIVYERDAFAVGTAGAGPSTLMATCPVGYVPVSGGYEATLPATVSADEVTHDGTGWQVVLRNYGTGQIDVYAACLPQTP